MSEYIDREQDKYIKLSQALEVLDSCACWWAHERMERIPAADVRPVVKSKWADNRISFYRGCPECGAFVRANLDEVFLRDFPSAVGKLNFCSNCGADMREES